MARIGLAPFNRNISAARQGVSYLSSLSAGEAYGFEDAIPLFSAIIKKQYVHGYSEHQSIDKELSHIASLEGSGQMGPQSELFGSAQFNWFALRLAEDYGPKATDYTMRASHLR